MLKLSEESAEYKLIREYIFNSYEVRNEERKKKFIMNIFAIERKGEAERIAPWNHLKNKMLLWHGSRISNFMGILAQGLRIAPPEAPASGYMFGKGVYFADMFEKSLGYTYDTGAPTRYKLLLLCEVALGEMLELKRSQFITQLQAPYKSVKGLGRKGPKMNKKVVLPNGCVAPIGKVVRYVNYGDTEYYQYSLEHNEYIVYDTSQIRMRYLVQVII